MCLAEFLKKTDTILIYLLSIPYHPSCSIHSPTTNLPLPAATQRQKRQGILPSLLLRHLPRQPPEKFIDAAHRRGSVERGRDRGVEGGLEGGASGGGGGGGGDGIEKGKEARGRGGGKRVRRDEEEGDVRD